jgi:hypothetical protein
VFSYCVDPIVVVSWLMVKHSAGVFSIQVEQNCHLFLVPLRMRITVSCSLCQAHWKCSSISESPRSLFNRFEPHERASVPRSSPLCWRLLVLRSSDRHRFTMCERTSRITYLPIDSQRLTFQVPTFLCHRGSQVRHHESKSATVRLRTASVNSIIHNE